MNNKNKKSRLHCSYAATVHSHQPIHVSIDATH